MDSIGDVSSKIDNMLNDCSELEELVKKANVNASPISEIKNKLDSYKKAIDSQLERSKSENNTPPKKIVI